MLGLYEIASGRLLSVGTVMPDQLPAGTATQTLPEGATYGVTHAWDASTAEWVVISATPITTMTPGDFARRVGFSRETYLNAVRRNPATPIDIGAQLDTLAAWLARVDVVDVADPITQIGVGLMAGVLHAGGQLPEGAEAFTAAMLAPVVAA